MKSSYKANNYGNLITSIALLYKPKRIIEFGVLDGYSLTHLLDGAQGAQVEAYDIFDDFPYNHADPQMRDKYGGIVRYGDFFTKYKDIEDNSIDLFHIDIANNGDTFQFFFDNYYQKLTRGGHALLEGGSLERDQCEWMIKYEKPRIQPVLRRCMKPYWIFLPFPSVTLVEKD